MRRKRDVVHVPYHAPPRDSEHAWACHGPNMTFRTKISEKVKGTPIFLNKCLYSMSILGCRIHC